MKIFVNANAVRVGDTVVLGNPKREIVVERVTQPTSGGMIHLQGAGGSWTLHAAESNRVRILAPRSSDSRA